MAAKADHLDWAEGNFGLAERLWESEDPVERRWSTVVAYYAILQTAHAVAADLWNEHPQDHFEVRNVVLRIDPSRTGLAANIQESAMISVGARYIGDHQSAATWFAPYFTRRRRHRACSRVDEDRRPRIETDRLELDAQQLGF
jgi:hypothetical protein